MLRFFVEGLLDVLGADGEAEEAVDFRHTVAPSGFQNDEQGRNVTRSQSHITDETQHRWVIQLNAFGLKTSKLQIQRIEDQIPNKG